MRIVLAAAGAVPRFAVDPYWPKPLPVDRHDHVWIIHRPRVE